MKATTKPAPIVLRLLAADLKAIEHDIALERARRGDDTHRLSKLLVIKERLLARQAQLTNKSGETR